MKYLWIYWYALYVRYTVVALKYINLSQGYSQSVRIFLSYWYGSSTNNQIVYDLTLCILVIVKGFKNYRLGFGSSVLTLVVRFVARFTIPFQIAILIHSK